MRLRHVTAATAGLLLAGTALAAPALAVQHVTYHDSYPAAGAQITCGNLQLEAVSGSIRVVFHENADAAGLFHYSSSNVADGVTLEDAAGMTYRLVGTSNFAGTSASDSGMDEYGDPVGIWTNTVSFTVLDSHGGRVGAVHAVEHLGPNGGFEMNLGDCVGVGGNR